MWRVRPRGIEPAAKSSGSGPAAVGFAVPSSAAASPRFESADFFVKDGRKIRVGDCALFRASDSAPFIGLICWFRYSEEVFPKLCVSWLYRPTDVKLNKGEQIITAPNEVFYSFHQDEISAGSLLHPCKVAFLSKGSQLPKGFPSYVCWRVYDIHNKCLWWLTDQDYIKERQEEVDNLLNRTWLEMQAVQSGGRSPKPLNGQPSTQQLKSGSDGVQSCSSFPAQLKGKKRDRCDQGMEHIKRERAPAKDDSDPSNSKFEIMKTELMKLTENNGMTTNEAVDKLVSIMQNDRNEKKIDLSGRLMLANIVAATESSDCLGRFVQLKGLPVLDDWIQEVHKGKNGDGSPKENDKQSEDLLMALLRALDKLPVNLNALQTCNIGKSVNHLRTHKNMEIQKKARYLVDIWKKRVDAEMKALEARAAGVAQPTSLSGKTGSSEVSHHGSRRTGELNTKNSITNVSASKVLPAKGGFPDALGKVNLSLTPVKSQAAISTHTLAGLKTCSGNANSELQLPSAKEEKSSSSSQSQNNSQSCSSEHGKAAGSSLKEDARSSPAGSASASKTSGGSSRHHKSNNGPLSSGGPKDVTAKSCSIERSITSEKTSQSGVTSEKPSDVLPSDNTNNHRSIIRFPNPSRSPAQSISAGSYEEPTITNSRASSPIHADKHEHSDRKTKVKTDISQPQMPADTNVDCCHGGDIKGAGGSNDCDRSSSAVHDDELARSADDLGKATCAPSTTLQPANDKSVVYFDSMAVNSFNPMNVLIESNKGSEISSPSPVADDTGMNLLASVAAGEMPKCGLNSPASSPRSPYTLGEHCGSDPAGKPKPRCIMDAAHTHMSSNEIENAGCENHESGGSLQSARKDPQQRSEVLSSEIKSSTQDSQVPVPAKPSVLSSLNDHSALEIITRTEEHQDDPHEKVQLSVPAPSELNQNNGDRQGEGTKLIIEKSGTCDKMKSEGSTPRIISGEDTSNDEKQHSLPHQSESFGNLADKSVELDTSQRDAAESTNLVTKGSVSVDIVPERTREAKEFSKEIIGEETSNCSVLPETEQRMKKSLPVEPDGKTVLTGPVIMEAASSLVGKDEPKFTNKLDFDLNEGISVDEASLPVAAPICPSPIHLSGMPNLITHAAVGLPAPAPAKGPFVSHENLLRTKSEIGWKGSAATSAFRPAEPRKLLEAPVSAIDGPITKTAGKQSRPPLDIDLNVADESALEEEASQSSAQTDCSESGNTGCQVIPSRTLGFDLDLNRADEAAENGHLASNSHRRVEGALFPIRPALLAFPTAEGNSSRDFDLNNGPGLDEAGTSSSRSHIARNTNGLQFLPAVPGIRMNSADMGSVPPWYHPGNSYPAVAIPSFLPDRAEQPVQYVAASGSQRVVGSVSGIGPFGSETYRGHVLNASSLGFPSPAPYSYPGFPFGQSFPPSSTSFSVGSTASVDSSATGSSFPARPQLGMQGSLPPHLSARPYVINLSESASAGNDNSRKWTRQGLDLNSGSGSVDADGKEDRLHLAPRSPMAASTVYSEEQARIYQVPGPGLKRKEPEGGRNADSSTTYKQKWW